MKKYLFALFIALLSVGQVFAFSTYYSKLTASNGGSGKGYVYLATDNKTAPTKDADYGASKSTTTNSSSQSHTYYAWAKAARGYKLSGWSGNSVTPQSQTGGYYALQVSASSTESSKPTTFTATASWVEATPYSVTFLAPENGSYSVKYSNIMDNSGNTGLTAYNKSYVPKDADELVSSYETDKIELTVTAGTFLGWYEVNGDSETLLSEESVYTLADGTNSKINSNRTIKALFQAPKEYQACVIDAGVSTNYKTFAEALAYANTLTTNPTLQLLDNVLDVTTSQSITASMTLDLNGNSFAGSVSKMLDINKAGIVVNIVDNSDTNEGAISMIGEANGKMYAVYVTKGTLNLQSGSIYAQNTADVTTSTSARAYGVYVSDGYTFNMTGGKIEVHSDQYGYGAQIGAGATTPAVGNFSGGTILVETKTKSRGILGYGQVNLSDNIDIQSTTISTTEAVGVYLDGAYNAKLTMTGGTISTTAQTTSSYGVWMNTASNSVDISGGSITAKISSSGTITAVGIYNNAAGTVNISGTANILAQAQTTTAYGVYNVSTGKVTLLGGTINAQSKTTTASGIYGTKAGTILVNGGTINATAGTNTAYGIYAAAGTVTIEDGAIIEATPATAYALYQKGATFNVNGGKMNGSTAPIYGTVGKVNVVGGFYKTCENLANFLTDDYKAYALTSGAAYNQGYRYQVADELPDGAYICKVTEKSKEDIYYYDLESALQYTNEPSNDMTIVMLNDYTLPAGNYTIPQRVTLLIPFDEANTCYTTTPMFLHGWNKNDADNQFWTEQKDVSDFSDDRSSVYRMLTLAPDAHLFINGTLSLSAKRHIIFDTGSQGTNLPNISGSGRIRGGYGCITMSEGSSIQVGNGTTAGKLYCWGRIRGEGSISVENGSEVREMFVYTDWRDNGKLANYALYTKCFPLNQFYIQDIQVPITFHYGSIETLRAGFFSSSGSPTQATDIPFIGLEGQEYLMTIASNSSITKKYDIPTDRLIFDFDGNVSFYRSKLTKGISVTTKDHIFPITNNWTININSGITNITYDMNLNAGAIINIHEDATLKLKSGASLYVYDADDWIWEGEQKYGNGFCSGRRIIPLGLPSCEVAAGTYRDANGQPRYIKAKYDGKTKYDAIRLEADLTDAEIRVDGTLIVEGGNGVIQTAKKSGLFTTNGVTWGSSYTELSSSRDMDGAKIYSTKSGKIIFNQGAGTQTSVDQLNKGTAYTDRAHVTIRSAMLKNAADGDYTSTADVTGKSTFKYFSEDGKWKKVSKVTFKDDDKIIKEDSVAQGDAINAPADPQKEGYTFTGWSNISDPMGPTDIISEAQWEQIVVVTTIEVTPTEVIISETEKPIENNTYTITEMTEATEVTIGEGATLNVADDVSLTVTEALVIKASENNSGDLPAADKIKIDENANVYFDYTFNTPAMRWNAIAFPWQVDANSGVKVSENSLVLGTDFDIIYYDGETRATRGPVNDCWKYVEDDINADVITDPAILVPGRLYMILFAQAQEVVRFAKATGASLVNTDPVYVKEYGGEGTNANWNGIANPALYHAYLDAGVEDGQVYDNDYDTYSMVKLKDTEFPVGKPVFVQAKHEQPVVVSKEQQPTGAPAYWAANENTSLRIEVELRNDNNVITDKVILCMDEDALDKYTIGSDLAKAGVSSKVAQMWVNRYGAKLCKNTIAPIDDIADYPLTIFAPTTGEYTLVPNIATHSGYTLYLTYAGAAFAELTDYGYTLELTKGNNSDYGLRLIKKQSGVVTSLDEALMLKDVQKVIYQGNLYIIRNKRIYNAAGQLIK